MPRPFISAAEAFGLPRQPGNLLAEHLGLPREPERFLPAGGDCAADLFRPDLRPVLPYTPPACRAPDLTINIILAEPQKS